MQKLQINFAFVPNNLAEIVLRLLVIRRGYLVGYLFIYLSRYLDQKIVKLPFRSSSQAATCYNLSNHSR